MTNSGRAGAGGASNPIPDNTTIDLHDLAAIFMYERMLNESLFSHFRLMKYHEGLLATLPDKPAVGNQTIVEDWDIQPGEGRGRKYFELFRDTKPVLGDIRLADGTTVVTPDSFDPLGEVNHPRMNKPIPYKERELMYWRCKNFDNGYGLAYAMQQVLDALPRSTKLSVRTKNRTHNVTISPPSEFNIMEMEIRTHELTHAVRISQIPGTQITSQHITGGDGGIMPWVYLFLGKATSADPENDTRVVLDLACTMLGGRGPAGEIFALQRGKEYLDETLAKVADDLGGEMKLSRRTVHRKADREELDRLAAAVLERVRQVVVDGVPFCAHCGSSSASMRCTR
jgi:hypothetical protein